MRIENWVVGLTLLGLPALSLAISVDNTRFAPEPETLGLIAGAAIAWAIVRWKKRK
jgi:PEP-CTERM motif